MRRMMILAYGALSYTLFLGAFLYAIPFLGDFGFVPKTINSGAVGPIGEALLINAVLLAAFAVQHSVMARRGFKRFLTRFIPVEAERSTFVLATNVAFILLYTLWRPMPTVIWQVDSPALAGMITAASLAGWAVVLLATIMIHHFDLFGMRQAWYGFRGERYRHLEFRTPGFYKSIRHPIQAGFLLAFWATPVMTLGKLVFCVMCTGYILVAVKFFEERDLVAEFGERYRSYMRQVPAYIPLPGRSTRAAMADESVVAGD